MVLSKLKTIFLLLLGFLLCNSKMMFATHNRAGEITFCQKDGNLLTYEFKVVTYTAVGPGVNADRFELFLYFGNTGSGCNIFDSIICPRINGPVGGPSNYFPNDQVHQGEVIQPGIKKNIYTGTYTFNGPGRYCIGMSDPNRNENIVNIFNSVNKAFYIQSELVISPFLGNNCSPELLNPPVDNACYCKPYLHNPGAYDPDGDSLSYALVNCQGDFGTPLDCYFIPSGISINAATGDLYWVCPGANTPNCNGNQTGGAGDYNVAIQINEWRNGLKIGSVIRDMQIKVVAGCLNNPPTIEPIDTCVVAGQNVNLNINATDADPGQYIEMSATGEPFMLDVNPASFDQTVNQIGNATLNIQWQTDCSRIRKNPYLMSIKAEDSYLINPLVDFKTLEIRVVAPPPFLNSVQAQGTSILLSWQASSCPAVVHYAIYRKKGPSSFLPGPCITGIPSGFGFEKVGEVSLSGNLTFVDNNNGRGLSHGFEYCYRIVGVYADGSESIASNERCARLKRDVPVITKVSVGITSATAGIDTLQWKKPLEYDSTQWPPPYSYRIERSTTGFSGFSVITQLNDINQLQFIDNNLNTSNNQYTYRIGFYSDTNLVGYSNTAQSPFLRVIPSDNKLLLRWTCDVPWNKDSTHVYKEEPPSSGNFIFLGKSLSDSFAISGLANGRQYCFRVVTFGAYTDTGFEKPLINFSQIACGIPEDRTPPCPPVFSLTPDCDKTTNTIRLLQTNRACFLETVSLEMYYTPVIGQALTLIRTYTNNDTLIVHVPDSSSIAGCYAFAGIDSAGNKSTMSDTLCVDNCPYYELPNVFTPNLDGVNEFFYPLAFKYVKEINMVIFDRWGTEVFKTTKPGIQWDGTNQKTGRICDQGVYFYVCDVGEIRLTGIVNRSISGFVQILGSGYGPGR
jgi:gliding motility-associated-like protein